MLERISSEIKSVESYGTIKEITVDEKHWSRDIENFQGDFKISKGRLGTFRFVIAYVPTKDPKTTRRLFI